MENHRRSERVRQEKECAPCTAGRTEQKEGATVAAAVGQRCVRGESRPVDAMAMATGEERGRGKE